MSTFRVTAERLTIHPHPNADALELAEVGLYRAVVAKNAYRTGDWAVYIPEQAVLPAGLIEELGLVGRLAGPRHDRVRAIRLRGELSQGIVCRPFALAGIDLAAAHADGKDFADHLGITKWVPEVPVHMAGVAHGVAELLDADRVGVFGEVYGRGVQDLHYGHDTKSGVPGYAVFDIAVDVAGKRRWLPQEEMASLARSALPVVPCLYDGPFDTATILGLAEGREQVSGRETCIREGVVVRPAVERYSDVLGGRAIVKAVSGAYLTRKGGTEYE